MALALPLTACTAGGEAHAPRRVPAPIPLPNLVGAEPQVEARINESIALVRQQPGSSARWGGLGLELHAHRFFSEAAACYEEAAALDRSDYRWPYLAGVSLLTSQPSEALEWLGRAAELTPASAAFRVTYGTALLEAGDATAAREQFLMALSIQEDFPYALLGLGQAALREGKPEEALEHLERAARAAPWIRAVHEARARAWEQKGDTTRSELAALAARACRGEPEMADPVIVEVRSRGVSARDWTDRGLEMEREGKLAAAEAALRKVIEIQPGASTGYSNLGGLLSRMSRFDKAIEAFEKALAITPADAVAHNGLGFVLLQKGDLGRAEPHLQAALSADGKLADALYNMALLRIRQARGAEAQELLRRTLDADPAHRGALTRLGAALVASGQAAEGMTLWRRAVDIDPLNFDARYNLALALARRGEHAEAIGHLEEALAGTPDNPRFMRILAWELATAPDDSLRDGRRAAELASRAHASLPGEPRSSDILAAAMAEAGRWAEAVHAAEEAIRLARLQGESAMADEISARLEGYKAGRPHWQPARAR